LISQGPPRKLLKQLPSKASKEKLLQLSLGDLLKIKPFKK